MYVDLGTTETSTAKLTFYSDIATAIANRLWNVKVSQIECTADWKAPQGCTQYFMGVRNTLYSYNHLGALTLTNQDMTYCVRREGGYCGLRWRDTGVTTPDAFALDTTTSTDANAETQTCANQWISSPGGITFATGGAGVGKSYYRHCGTVFGEEAKDVASESNPTSAFDLNFYSGATASKTTDTGFAMRYEQQPCT